VEEVRDKVMDLLATYYARGALELEEYENRVSIATRSQTREELEALAGNLPALMRPESGTPAAAPEGGPEALLPDGEVRPTQTLAAVFSSINRRGRWALARRTQAFAFFGSTDLDLRQARLPAGVSTITVFALFGSVSVIVPPGVNVEMNGAGVFGAFDTNVPEDRRPGVPTIRVDGVAVFGSANVRIKWPR
jgi:hypothetical protein